jgi:hypothetical protein
MAEKEKKKEIIEKYVTQAQGLEIKREADSFEIIQTIDRKGIRFYFDQLEDVLVRDDTNDKPFLQINFTNGDKILITEELIGFKPYPLKGFDVTKLPKVVTTSDLVSVFEAAEEAHSSGRPDEVNVLKQVFNCIILGGEQVGFDLKNEKTWFTQLLSKSASA